METWRDIIRQFLYKKDWTQDRLAKEAKITPSRLSDIMNGKREPSLDYLRRLGKALGVEPSQLLALHEGLEAPERPEKGAGEFTKDMEALVRAQDEEIIALREEVQKLEKFCDGAVDQIERARKVVQGLMEVVMERSHDRHGS